MALRYVYIIPKRPDVGNRPDNPILNEESGTTYGPQYLFSHPSRKIMIEKNSKLMADREECPYSLIQIHELWIPEKRYKAYYLGSTYRDESVLEEFLAENNKHLAMQHPTPSNEYDLPDEHRSLRR